MAEMIPPAVIDILGRDTDLLTTITRDKAALADFAKTITTARIGADSGQFQTDLSTVKSELLNLGRQVNNAKIGADSVLFWSKIATLRNEIRAMSPLDVNIDANTAAAMAKIAALKAALDVSKLDALMGGVYGPKAGVGGGGGGAGAAGAVGLAATLKGILGFGTAGVPFLGGLAGMGTLGAFAGLGPEHVIMTLLGLGGSAGAGMLGGGLLGLGAGGVMGVGMGTDMAGIGQAAGDTKSTVSAQNALSQAIAVYGKNSIQASVAQAQLNYTISGFPKVAQGAIVAAANTAQGFHKMFNSLTGPAEKIGAQILTQVMKVGESFLPTIGASAAQNMAIIKKDLQPLFSWLQNSSATGGLGIFKNLERIFTAQLPTSIHALTQGIELFMKTVNVAAGYTGGFVKKLDGFLTRTNSPTGFAAWSKEIGKLIGDFRIWEAFIHSVFSALYHLFHAGAGTGNTIIQTLTNMLNALTKWETSAKGAKSLNNLFNVHLGEVKQLLALIPPLVVTFGKIEMAVAPAATAIATLILKFINLMLHIPKIGPLLAMGAGLAFIASRMKLLGPIGALFTGAGKDAGFLERAIGKLGAATGIQTLIGYIGTMASSFASAVGGAIASGAKWIVSSISSVARVVATNVAGAATSAAAWIAANALMAVGIAVLIAAVVVGVIEMIKHWRGLVTGIKDVWNAIKEAWDKAWGAIKKAADAVWGALKTFLHSTIGQIVLFLMNPIAGLVNFFVQHWATIHKDAVSAWNAVLSFLKGIGRSIIDVFKDAGSWLLNAGKDIIHGLEHGIKSVAMKPVDAIKGVGSKILSGFKSILHIFSPSQDMSDAGEFLMQGLVQGIQMTTYDSQITTHLTSIATKMLSYLKLQMPLFHDAGVAMMQGLSKGISDASAQVATAAVKAANDAVSATNNATKTHSPSQVFAEQGTNWMLGLVQGIRGGAAGVQGALTGSIPRVPNGSAFGLSGTGGASLTVHADFHISAPGGNPQAIKQAIEKDSAHEFAKQALVSLQAGAGTVYGR
jgi:hypothetical protein